MTTLGFKLKSLRKSRNLTLEQLASSLNKKNSDANFTKGRLSVWENDKEEPKLSSTKMIADYFNVSLDYLIGLTDSPQKKAGKQISLVKSTDFKQVPLVGSIACGSPLLAEQNIEDYVPMYLADSSQDDVIFALRCKGKSMEPTLRDGDIVFVKQQSVVEDGEVAAVLVDSDESATLKRIKHVGKQVLLMPDNTDGFSPIVLDKNNPGQILGKVIESRRKF